MCRCSAAYNYAVSSHYTIVNPEEIARNCNCMHPMPRFPCDDSAPTEGNTRCFQVNLPVQQEESRREDIQHRDIAYNGNKVFPPMLAANLLSSLKHMVPKYPQPSQSFYLNGIDSGILLPKLYAWPKMGYTFNLWLCLRRPYNHSNPLTQLVIIHSCQAMHQRRETEVSTKTMRK